MFFCLLLYKATSLNAINPKRIGYEASWTDLYMKTLTFPRKQSGENLMMSARTGGKSESEREKSCDEKY